MKVAIHVDQLWAQAPGGIGTYIRHLMPALRELEGVNPVPFHATFTGEEPEELRGMDSVEIPGSIKRLYPSWDLMSRPALPSTLSDCAVVHATNHVAVPPVGSHQRLVVTVHDLAFRRFPDAFDRRWRWIYAAGVRAATRRADAVIVPSRSTADDLVEKAGCDPAKIHVVPLAAALPKRSTEPDTVLNRLKIPRPFILSLGTIEPRKNQTRLVRAYRDATERHGLPHSLVLAGPEGWGVAKLLHELATPGAGRVIRTGPLSSADVDALLRAADALAYPSLYEGFGLPILEAMARGIPVITSATSSMPDVAGDAALLVDPVDESAISEAIGLVLTDQERASHMSAAGARRAAEFSWELTAARTAAVYEDVLGGRSR